MDSPVAGGTPERTLASATLPLPISLLITPSLSHSLSLFLDRNTTRESDERGQQCCCCCCCCDDNNYRFEDRPSSASTDITHRRSDASGRHARGNQRMRFRSVYTRRDNNNNRSADSTVFSLSFRLDPCVVYSSWASVRRFNLFDGLRTAS